MTRRAITWNALPALRVSLLVSVVIPFTLEGCIWNGERPLTDIDAGDSVDLANGGDSAGKGTGGGIAGTAGTAGDGGFGGVAGTNGGFGGASEAGVGGAPAGAGGGPGSGGNAGGSGGSSGATGSGPDGSIDAFQPDNAAADIVPSNDANTPPTACGLTRSTTRIWSFATDIEGWDFADGTMTWTGALGDPSPGALQVDWTASVPVHPRRVEALGDLRGRVVTAWIWVAPGPAVGVKVFVQTGSRYWWADGGVVTPPPGQWTCVTLDIDNPAYSRQLYDPTDVQVIGLELQTTTSSRAYIDQVAY
jgi:hypothetical protein